MCVRERACIRVLWPAKNKGKHGGRMTLESDKNPWKNI
jgi:hypothetical protein